jgi:hypothetical protein
MYRWCNPNQQRLLATSSSTLILSCVVHAEVHAALAAALYADKHDMVPAEQQFTIATLLDSRYTNPSWVKSTKHWPPSLIASLQKFIALRWSLTSELIVRLAPSPTPAWSLHISLRANLTLPAPYDSILHIFANGRLIGWLVIQGNLW